MTALEERYNTLKQSIKHHNKVLAKTNKLIEKETIELNKLEKKIFICPNCNKAQELKNLKATNIICRYCGLNIIKT